MTSVAGTEDSAAGARASAPDGQSAAWRDGKRYAWLLGGGRPDAPVHRLRVGASDRARVLLVLGADPDLRRVPAARPGDRPRRRESPGQRAQVARAGPLLPLVHVRVPPAPVRRARVRVLAVGERRPDRAGQDRASADRGDGERDRDQHRARARPQARPARALAEQDRAGPERIRPLLRRAQPRPSRARGDARGSRRARGSARASGRSCRAPCREPRLGVGARAGVAGARRALAVELAQQRSQRVGDDRGAVRRR